MALFVSGLNHRTAPVDLREQLAVEKDKLRELLTDILATTALQEIVLLSTCNRVELYGVVDTPDDARREAFRHLVRYRGVDLATVESCLYTHADSDAVRHAFRVASSLDSMIVGESQILGQMKDAFAAAQSAETVGPRLHTLFTQAFAVAKKIRTETEIGRNAVSVSFAAVELARKIFDGLRGRAVLLVGAGGMGELAARHLVEHEAFPIYVANRTWARAQEVARALSGVAVPWDELPTALAAADIVIAATGATAPIITREVVQHAMHARRGRALFLIDIAVPRDVEAAVDTLDDVYCYDVDDLNEVVKANLRERMREAQRAEGLVDRETQRYVARLTDVDVIPTIVSLRKRLEAIRVGEVQKTLARLPHATPEIREAIDALSTAVVNKILHSPITKLRESARAGAARSWRELIDELFGLGGDHSSRASRG